MMTDDQILEVVRAHKEGKKIRFRPHGAMTWQDVEYVQWNFQGCDYDVAPEPRKPREYWLIREPSDQLTDVRFRAYACHQQGVGYFEQIHVREVIE